MKKIIGIIFISLMFANIGYAEMRLIERKIVDGNYLSSMCVDGYKFVTTVVPVFLFLRYICLISF